MWSHEVAHLEMFVTWLRLAVWRSQKRLLQSFLGFLHWQVRPRGVACPFAAGAYCWLREEGFGRTPVAVLESLVVLQTVAAEPCRWPGSRPRVWSGASEGYPCPAGEVGGGDPIPGAGWLVAARCGWFSSCSSI